MTSHGTEKLTLAIFAAALALALAPATALAKNGHGNSGNSGSHMSTQGSFHTNGSHRQHGKDRAATAHGWQKVNHGNNGHTHGNNHGNAGGQSALHMSAQGLANTNGPNATNRQFGRDRAAQRHAMHNINEETTTRGLNAKALERARGHSDE